MSAHTLNTEEYMDIPSEVSECTTKKTIPYR